MQEYAEFTRRREGLWDSLTARIRAARGRPASLTFDGLESLAIDYRRLLQDYAAARVRFPGMAATRRLETAAVDATHFLFAEESRDRFSVRRFIGRTFPAAMRLHGPYIAFCWFLFTSAFLMALSGAILQAGIGPQILGAETMEGLERGELWTVRLARTMPAPVAAAAIAVNNMAVGIGAWAGGALLGAGALFAVFYNGLHLGAALGTTVRFGLASRLLEFMAAHGPLELMLIMTCAGHGLAIGHAILSPGDRTRRAAAAHAARPAMAGLVVAVPLFLFLGFVEGFISPEPSIPISFKAGLGVVLLVAFLLAAFRSPSERKLP